MSIYIRKVRFHAQKKTIVKWKLDRIEYTYRIKIVTKFCKKTYGFSNKCYTIYNTSSVFYIMKCFKILLWCQFI